MRTALWVGIAGFFGAIARYWMAGLASNQEESFPWGTFVVNVSGSFALGLLVSAFAHRFVVHPDLRVALTVGFLGAYTTFSTLALESFEFIETGTVALAIVNVTGTVVAGMLAVWLGSVVGRAI